MPASHSAKPAKTAFWFNDGKSPNVADSLDKLGFDVDKRRITMPKTVKEIGEYDISYRAHPEVSIPMKLVVHAAK